jgi:hypothetical protein
MPATKTHRECPSCSRDISALKGDTCFRLRCKRNVENERRRGILDAVVSTLREAKENADTEVRSFTEELLATLQGCGVAR